MVGVVFRVRREFWYGGGEVSRRTSRFGMLGLVLLLVASTPAGAQEEPVTSASVVTSVPAAPPPAPRLLPAATALVAKTKAKRTAKATAAEKTRTSAKPKRDFLVGKWKLRRLKWRELYLNSGSEVSVVTEPPTDARGIPMRHLGLGGKLVYNPTVIAQQGMKRLDSYKQTGKKVHLRQARKFIDKLAELSEGGRIRRWQPHDYPYRRFEPGWVNANSHGLVLSFVSRYYRITGNKKRFADAKRLVAAYRQRPKNERWFSDTTKKGYLWFEHWPDGKHTHTLNAHLNAMFGLYDYWLVTGSPLARDLFLGGAKTVRDKLRMFRRPGDLSRYSLRVEHGTLHYHETHIAQLRVLAKITGSAWFDHMADRFVKDEEAWKAKYRAYESMGGR